MQENNNKLHSNNSNRLKKFNLKKFKMNKLMENLKKIKLIYFIIL